MDFGLVDEQAAESFIGVFTRDMTLASGSQGVTGVGFTPKYVIFLGVRQGTQEVSWGFDNNLGQSSTFNDGSGGNLWVSTASLSVVLEIGALSYRCQIDSFDVDGFTVGWTRIGAKTGTATVRFMALR